MSIINILFFSRWHVRTKENIARVRKDEAEAAEKERQEKIRIETANREARLNVLKQKSKEKLSALGVDKEKLNKQTTEVPEHINLFTDIDHSVSTVNKEHEKELKEKQEEYEKNIGYLTYLGQNTNESLKKKNWYEVASSARFSESANIKDSYEKLVLKDVDGKPRKKHVDVHNGEYDWKAKQRHDPINKFKKYCRDKIIANDKMKLDNDNSDKSQNKTNKSKDISSDKYKNLQKLREARLKREQAEKYKTELFLSGFTNTTLTCQPEATSNMAKIKPKYNSQFNPELARQNYRD
ncbi:unnamed protein product [Diatraea saccharalis]|uniref:CBF1-interacting co-repressor CIR N-terminal domain-containing protein n=1 Tax=Diatraea saccharalis TaxID=40085 RepID=A0A9N9WJZ1_9NEOP|nr:unnamed protein product [Diatraea saccharalis]